MKNITGKKFNYLTAIKPIDKYICKKTNEWRWLCVCECGKYTNVRISSLTSGGTKSCGCKKFESKNLANKNGNWSGDSVGYSQLHSWVKSRLPKPEKCQECMKNAPYDLSNKGIYDRNINNWEWLCRRCHMIKDGRMKVFINSRRNTK